MNPIWQTASAQGPRAVNADAVAAYADPATQQVVFALADGVGDASGAAHAARLAATAAAHTPAAEGPVQALLAAQEAVRADPSAGDCVLVVALPFDGGYRVGWVGDARAYVWTGAGLTQVTKDHTLAQYFRDHGQPPAPRMEHVVTTSVRTAGATEFGRAEISSPAGLLLTSDGVHKTLSLATMAELLRRPANSAEALTGAAIAAGGSDNATALFVECPPAVADVSTIPFHAAA
ncbi:protein phosphatase 2C domain-containing protein [Amycolatopsis acidiphila]|uniref:Serine/threonine protein phosphatase n=1 Tax=Amycolatopsis acidiphila TaxID=715473 RepID=A0A558A517_9PSEU|nr:protein phosphatase 2C domain-containing protein [Amycolatopsis acidiphila]TVT19369.1 serine/threonine protein phosphatase [Amycolatopsis acidiphila]UIJ61732.1 protein phosphatase 2C domain-containing protein [Amycolatopsis acidiphila]GHG58156.1 serine/threonine protein phosphatase [Amycolatopsis acidiphila]